MALGKGGVAVGVGSKVATKVWRTAGARVEVGGITLVGVSDGSNDLTAAPPTTLNKNSNTAAAPNPIAVVVERRSRTEAICRSVSKRARRPMRIASCRDHSI